MLYKVLKQSHKHNGNANIITSYNPTVMSAE